VLGVISALSLPSVDLVGQDLGGLIGIWLALEQPGILRGLSVVASPMSPPTADGLDNLLLVSPPQPLWGRESQQWALDRLSYSHQHISKALLDACVAAGEGAPHRAASAAMKDGYARTFMPSLNRTKYRLWEVCRNDGVKVPVQLVWASHDPASPRDSGFVLFNAIAPRQQLSIPRTAGGVPPRRRGLPGRRLERAAARGRLIRASALRKTPPRSKAAGRAAELAAGYMDVATCQRSSSE
jgi:pimeloyl-ACP methyl ester carboxylesterase